MCRPTVLKGEKIAGLLHVCVYIEIRGRWFYCKHDVYILDVAGKLKQENKIFPKVKKKKTSGEENVRTFTVQI